MTLLKLAEAMTADFQKRDLATRHALRKKIYEATTGLPYREKKSYPHATDLMNNAN